MDAIIIKPRKKSDIDSVLEFARSRNIPAKTVNEEIIEDSEYLEELEDKYLLALMEEREGSDRISREKIFELLDR